jgi:tRNA nucleotidyltransferase (CCA-adding enzyme)
MAALGLLRVLHPSLRPSRGTRALVARAARALGGNSGDRLDPPERWVILLALLASELSPRARRTVAERLQATPGERALLAEGRTRSRRLLAWLQRGRRRPSAIRERCAKESLATVWMARALARDARSREELARYLAELRFARPSISGRDLLAAGVPEGPRIARGLAAALRAKLDGGVAGRDEQLRAALRAAHR